MSEYETDFLALIDAALARGSSVVLFHLNFLWSGKFFLTLFIILLLLTSFPVLGLFGFLPTNFFPQIASQSILESEYINLTIFNSCNFLNEKTQHSDP